MPAPAYRGAGWACLFYRRVEPGWVFLVRRADGMPAWVPNTAFDSTDANGTFCIPPAFYRAILRCG